MPAGVRTRFALSPVFLSATVRRHMVSTTPVSRNPDRTRRLLRAAIKLFAQPGVARGVGRRDRRFGQGEQADGLPLFRE